MMNGVEATSGVFFDEAQGHRLADLYSPCFTLILQLRSTREFGDAEVLRRRIKDLLDQSERDALRAGLPSDDCRDAKFALVAFIDETILSSEWSRKDRWIAKPLQLEFYDRYDAGEAFFERLEQLRAQPASNAEVLEVYYLCMALGFKGRYQLHDQERLRVLIEETFATLSQLSGMRVGALSPRGRPRDQTATEVQSRFPAWVIAVVAACLAFVVYFGMNIYMGNTADDTVEVVNRINQRTEPVR